MLRAWAVLFLFAGLGLAQVPEGPPPPYFPWWESAISNRLNLTSSQRDQIQEIQRQFRDRMIDERAAAQKAEAAISDLFAADEINDRAANRAIDELVKTREALTRSLTEMSLKLRQVLTAEQWHRLRSFQERREDMRRRGTPLRGPRGNSRGPADQTEPPAPDPR